MINSRGTTASITRSEMSRPGLTISTFGDITIRVAPSGRFEARTRYRDWDGQTRQVQATDQAADRSPKSKLVAITSSSSSRSFPTAGPRKVVTLCGLRSSWQSERGSFAMRTH